ncbi:MAG: nuclear transport factor 2 family protein [Alphaproteobacteria bacterium]|nr:nuclear transport factor 2 family protein [Alphaproteobacteria bacterium]
MSTDLPAPIQALITASEQNDMKAFLAAFHEDALLTDSHRKFWGLEGIRRWVSIEWIGDFVEFKEIRDVIEHRGDYIVFAVLGGIYDPEGLPGDYVVTFNFKIVDGKIARLIILNFEGRRLGKLTQTRMASTCFSAPMPGLQ